LVTGTGPHSGDAGDIARIAFDPVVISRFHALSVYVFCALLLVILVTLHRLPGRHQALTARWTLLAVTIAQGVIGYVQYLTGLPELLVFFHLLGAACFAAGITWVGTRLVTWQDPAEIRDHATRPSVTDTAPGAGAARCSCAVADAASSRNCPPARRPGRPVSSSPPCCRICAARSMWAGISWTSTPKPIGGSARSGGPAATSTTTRHSGRPPSGM